jgi:hypothetical protein
MIDLTKLGAIRPPNPSSPEIDMELKLYRVVREHMGPEGQLYSPHGDLKTREAFPHEVAHLVPQTLELAQEEPAPENKAEHAPENAAAKRAPRKPKET